jgi:hypothetical protein
VDEHSKRRVPAVVITAQEQVKPHDHPSPRRGNAWRDSPGSLSCDLVLSDLSQRVGDSALIGWLLKCHAFIADKPRQLSFGRCALSCLDFAPWQGAYEADNPLFAQQLEGML